MLGLITSFHWWRARAFAEAGQAEPRHILHPVVTAYPAAHLFIPTIQFTATSLAPFSKKMSAETTIGDSDSFLEILEQLQELIQAYYAGQAVITMQTGNEFARQNKALIIQMSELHLVICKRLNEARSGVDKFHAPEVWWKVLSKFLTIVSFFCQRRDLRLNFLERQYSPELAYLLENVIQSAVLYNRFRSSVAADTQLLSVQFQITLIELKVDESLVIEKSRVFLGLKQLATLYLNSDNIFSIEHERSLDLRMTVYKLANEEEAKGQKPLVPGLVPNAARAKEFIILVAELVLMIGSQAASKPIAEQPSSFLARYALITESLTQVLKYCQHHLEQQYFIDFANRLGSEKFLNFVMQGAKQSLLSPTLVKQLLLQWLLLLTVSSEILQENPKFDEDFLAVIAQLKTLTADNSDNLWSAKDYQSISLKIFVAFTGYTNLNFLTIAVQQPIRIPQFIALLDLLRLSAEGFKAHYNQIGAVIEQQLKLMVASKNEFMLTTAQLNRVANSYATLLAAYQSKLLTLDTLKHEFSLDGILVLLAALPWFKSHFNTIIEFPEFNHSLGQAFAHHISQHTGSENLKLFEYIFTTIGIGKLLNFIKDDSDQTQLPADVQWQLLMQVTVAVIVYGEKFIKNDFLKQDQLEDYLNQLIAILRQAMQRRDLEACWVAATGTFDPLCLTIPGTSVRNNTFLQLVLRYLNGPQCSNFLSLFIHNVEIFIAQCRGQSAVSSAEPPCLTSMQLFNNRLLSLLPKEIDNNVIRMKSKFGRQLSAAFAFYLDANEFKLLSAELIADAVDSSVLIRLIVAIPSLNNQFKDLQNFQRRKDLYSLLFKALKLQCERAPALAKLLYQSYEIFAKTKTQCSVQRVASDLELFTSLSALVVVALKGKLANPMPESLTHAIFILMGKGRTIKSTERNYYSNILFPVLGEFDCDKEFSLALLKHCVIANAEVPLKTWRDFAMTTCEKYRELPPTVVAYLTKHCPGFSDPEAPAFDKAGKQFSNYLTTKPQPFAVVAHQVLAQIFGLSLIMEMPNREAHSLELSFQIPTQINLTMAPAHLVGDERNIYLQLDSENHQATNLMLTTMRNVLAQIHQVDPENIILDREAKVFRVQLTDARLVINCDRAAIESEFEAVAHTVWIGSNRFAARLLEKFNSLKAQHDSLKAQSRDLPAVKAASLNLDKVNFHRQGFSIAVAARLADPVIIHEPGVLQAVVKLMVRPAKTVEAKNSRTLPLIYKLPLSLRRALQDLKLKSFKCFQLTDWLSTEVDDLKTYQRIMTACAEKLTKMLTAHAAIVERAAAERAASAKPLELAQPEVVVEPQPAASTASAASELGHEELGIPDWLQQGCSSDSSSGGGSSPPPVARTHSEGFLMRGPGTTHSLFASSSAAPTPPVASDNWRAPGSPPRQQLQQQDTRSRRGPPPGLKPQPLALVSNTGEDEAWKAPGSPLRRDYSTSLFEVSGLGQHNRSVPNWIIGSPEPTSDDGRQSEVKDRSPIFKNIHV